MRTLGAKDKKKRKVRSDKKHKYRKNRMGNLVIYKPKRKRDDPLRVWFWERLPMSWDGYKRFPRRVRPYIHKKITRFVDKPFLVEPEQLSTKENIAQLAVNVICHAGEFILMLPTHSKNTHHVSYKKKVRIRIVETEDGLKAKVIRIYSGFQRYWFWSGK